MNAIMNMKQYTDDLAAGLEDKLFFTSIVQPDSLVDFGCADGTLLRAYRAKEKWPVNLVGYDNSKEMVDIAVAESHGYGIHYDTDWSPRRWFPYDGGTTAVLLSSVIHEMFTYLDNNQLDADWAKVWKSDFDYVIIRDTMAEYSIDRPANPIDTAKAKVGLPTYVIKSWEPKWGPLTGNLSLVHLMLTYHYQGNWIRELNEDYFPVFIEAFLDIIPKTYRPVYMDHYTLPYTRDKVKSDLDITIQDKTHVKFIFKKV